MFLTDRWYFIFLLLLHLPHVEVKSVCQHVIKNQIIVVALLNLYDETTQCSKISKRGIQQMASLEKAIFQTNFKDSANEGMSLVLHVINTCTPPNTEIDIALKSLVISQQTCLNPPLLIGFIGPENHNQLQIMHQITSEFNKFHVLPFAPNIKQYKEENFVMYVENSRFELRSKIILSILNQVKWRSIYVIIGDNMAVTGVLDYILKELDHVCITGVAKLPVQAIDLHDFYSSSINEFQESGANGILIFVEKPGHIRPLLHVISNQSSDNNFNFPFIIYINQIGLNSWELPRNYTILLLQETNEVKNDSNIRQFYNKTLWDQYIEENNLDYRSDAFGDLQDSTVTPYEYALKLLWNAAKYAKKIKCNLGVPTFPNSGICYDLLYANSLDWKIYLRKASYYEISTTKKISFEMDVSINVNVYFIQGLINFPQLIGHITETKIDLKLNLQKMILTSIKVNPKRCMSSTTSIKNENVSRTISIDHKSNWLAVFSRKMKNIVQLEGLVTPETNEKLNTCLLWLIGFIVFISGLILMIKCVYRIFRIPTPEQEEERKRKYCRNARIQST